MSCSVDLLRIVVTGIGLALLPAAAIAQQGGDARVADLLQAGALRAGLPLVAPHFAVKDAATGEIRGLSADVGRALAARLHVTFVPIEYPSIATMIDGLKTKAWDVAFLNLDPSRDNLMDFSNPFQDLDVTYVVPAGSAIRTVADADQPNIHIVTVRNSAEANILKGVIKQGQIQVVDTSNDASEALRTGSADAFAIVRPSAIGLSGRLPGSRVLDDRIGALSTAIAISKGQTGRLSYLNDFIEEVKASGLVQQSIERNRVLGVRPLSSDKSH